MEKLASSSSGSPHTIYNLEIYWTNFNFFFNIKEFWFSRKTTTLVRPFFVIRDELIEMTIELPTSDYLLAQGHKRKCQINDSIKEIYKYFWYKIDFCLIVLSSTYLKTFFFLTIFWRFDIIINICPYIYCLVHYFSNVLNFNYVAHLFLKNQIKNKMCVKYHYLNI